MNVTQVVRVLTAIEKVFGKRNIKILDNSVFPYQQVLAEARNRAESSWRKFRANSSQHPMWGYEISDTFPLCFVPSEVLNGVRVDIYCDVKWSTSAVPVKQDIKLRVWSDHKSTVFRPDFDSVEVRSRLDSSSHPQRGRVISRFHFDKASHAEGKSSEYHPEFHLQIGGISKDYELCWHPHSFDIPRIAHHPMDLFLTCQVVAMNFFPRRYYEIGKESLWIEQLHVCQNAFMLEYYEACVKTIKEKKSLMDSLRSKSF